MDAIWDCVVVGGGAAGLSAALVLGRARRRTLVVDAGAQSNLSAHGIGGLLGFDGRTPAELYAAGRAELAAYPSVEVRIGEVVDAQRADDGFALLLQDGRRVATRRIVLAGGMSYDVPALAGVDRLWGRSVFHCPFCHGWEVRDQPVAVLARGPRAVHAALLLRGWSDDVVVLTDGPADLGSEDRARLTAAGVDIDERTVAGLRIVDDGLEAIEFAEGASIDRRALMVTPRLRQRSPLAAQLGVRFQESHPLAEDAVAVDEMQRTSVPGVFAAGDVCVQVPQVAAAVAAGSLAGASVMQTLMADDHGLPVPEWKEHVNV
ncbi:NAD(P)/FAD-dependent oxidoreductase [Mycolicibacterium arseniciresistens]|uniref:NAD(P)/FAD-dependent oxidoreductase n=1 Tax=Mycolicibacterium arseniciresistens TaxID=3062257 RepID=A0ABT8UGK8_9MYCO|nr:NAD(P)/FAD-dependent oxidoreductase [Mycolicibacterium arseniciresistens]MDO3636937.1 NAD(P)/FAD-dependent oxidoreductase [Mycolicibacterium arseniciresistens]